MKLEPIGLFVTPESVQELQDYIENLPSHDKPIAAVVMGMTWNLCAKLTGESENGQIE